MRRATHATARDRPAEVVGNESSQAVSHKVDLSGLRQNWRCATEIVGVLDAGQDSVLDPNEDLSDDILTFVDERTNRQQAICYVGCNELTSPS